VELVDGMDLGRDRRIEHGCDRRRESRSEHLARVGLVMRGANEDGSVPRAGDAGGGSMGECRVCPDG